MNIFIMDESPPQPTGQSPPPLPPPSNHTGSPTDFLKNVVGKKVIVRLLSGVDYRGAKPSEQWQHELTSLYLLEYYLVLTGI